jgi:hypothetical protein
MQWLLLIAALCLVAQSTVLPLVSPATSVWTPVHEHITINGIVPPHTHAYDTPGHQSSGQPSCVVTDASTVPGSTHNESMVCAPAGDGATASTAIVVHHGLGVWQLPVAGVESLATPALQRDWHSIAVRPLTPPPQP